MLDQTRQPGPAGGLALDDALGQTRRPGVQAHTEDLLRPDRIQQLVDLGLALQRLSDEQELMPSLAIELAGHPELPGPLLVVERRMRPHQHLDFDGGVGDVVV
jgi:hypothetical protein